jgi:hypothetical protein
MLGGWVELDMLYNSARPVAPGTPFFLTPRRPFPDDTFDAHSKQSSLYVAAIGPQIGEFQSGGLILVALYNSTLIADIYGILPYQAYGELKNESWRFAGGLMFDVFAPVLPTMLTFAEAYGSGNTGLFHGQLRMERFLYPADDTQITLQAAISNATPTIVANDTLTEDNGWPNVQIRAAWSAGEVQQVGLVAQRPFEVGVSATIGQIRSTGAAAGRVVSNVWGLAADLRWRINEVWGVVGEVFTGQAMGGYGGGVLQSVNSLTFDAIHATGGWMEVYYYFTPCLHTHWGLGADDPLDRDLSRTQIAYNKTLFANLIWDVTQSFRLGFELTYRKTNYIALPDNDGVGMQWQIKWSF